MKIIKIPFSAGSIGKNIDCNLAPDALVNGLRSANAAESGINPSFSVDEVKVEQTNISETQENIFRKISGLNEKAIILGGDHSITFPSFKAFSEKNKNSCLVVFDAHPDCDEEAGIATHDTYVRNLIKDGIKPSHIILIGIRSFGANEMDFLRQNKVNFFSMKQLFDQGIKESCDLIMEQLRQFDSLYLSVDIDVVDPAFAPGTGYCEPGGLSSRELIYFLQRLNFLKNIKLFDLVEINPKKDINNLTVNLGVKIIAELSASK